MGVGPKKSSSGRAWYPSGPKLDGSSGRDDYPPPPPLKPRRTKRTDDPNPDPTNYQIVKAEEHGKYLIIKINYPNCTNYEGNKILVFKATLLELVNQKVIDPHFFNNKDFKSPIARFVPTDEGWGMARILVSALEAV